MSPPRFDIYGLISSHQGTMDQCALKLKLHAMMVCSANYIASHSAQTITESRSHAEISLNTTKDRPDRKTHTTFPVSA
jgi:xylose isomerase